MDRERSEGRCLNAGHDVTLTSTFTTLQVFSNTMFTIIFISRYRLQRELVRCEANPGSQSQLPKEPFVIPFKDEKS